LNPDAVFTRSFSALILSAILFNNNQRKFLKDETLEELFERVKRYITKEKDFRGFVIEKGWAHSAAHIADVIGCFASNENISTEKVFELLYVYKDMFLGSNDVFTHNEDERIIEAVSKLYERADFDENQLIKWIETIDKSMFKNAYPEDQYITINSKLLLRSLYFKLLNKGNSQIIVDAILKQLDLFKF